MIAKKAPLKKGNSSWKPSSLNEFYDKEEGYRYRMVSKDPKNLVKKRSEGWETVSGINGADTKQQDPNTIEQGKPLTSVQEGIDWVLQRIPEERALERDAYYDIENDRRISGLTAHIKQEVQKEGGNTHGEITISSRKRTQTFE